MEKKEYSKPSIILITISLDIIRTSGENDGVKGFDPGWLNGGEN